MTVHIRPLGLEDAAPYWHLRLEALEQTPLAFGMSAEEHRETTPESEARRLLAGTSENFVLGAFQGPQLRGMVGFGRQQRLKMRHGGGVWGMHVAPEVRGQGAGRLLMEGLIERVRACPGLDRLTLSVTTEQTAARQLYLSLGFETFGLERDALRVEGRSVDEEHLVLVLR
ncbi:GNAT family N-acetyltransferase [Deinococcus sp. NW-56]|uniref:GNAT family N-acetyltransferase n=1 Tax=Deinococcus sp. NW-56 TaxID=2080419 RepID=UPI000CF3BC1E|nr:GNAT family N-acetyltransferase [Deinococcus sp. NW-56]